MNTKLNTAIADGMTFLVEHGDFANDLDTLLGTTSDGFARSVLGYVIANGHPTARQMAAIERSANEVRRRHVAAVRTAYVKAKGEASVDVYPRNHYTEERGLTGLAPLPAAAMTITEEPANEVRFEKLTKTPPAAPAKGPNLDSLLNDLGL